MTKKITLTIFTLIICCSEFAKSSSLENFDIETLKARCDLSISRADEYFENGLTNDSKGFLQLSRSSIEDCRTYSVKAGWKKVKTFVRVGTDLCKESSQTEIHEGICMLNLSKTIRSISF